MESLRTVSMVVVVISGIALLLCEILMFKNRRVRARDWFLNPFSIFKPSLYNERGKQFRKIYLFVYIVTIIFAISIFIFMYTHYS